MNFVLTTRPGQLEYDCNMVRRASKPGAHAPFKRHYIQEWATTKGVRQVDVVKTLNVDKGLVSKWFSGARPGPEYQARLADMLGILPEDIFKNPDEQWVSSFLRGRSEEEIGRIKEVLRNAFPETQSRANQ